MSLAPSSQTRCSACGATFECGMAQEQPCWCSTQFMPVLPAPEDGAACLCPDCLGKKIESRRTGAEKSVI